MDENIEETIEMENDETIEEPDFDSTNISKWAWVMIGAIAAAGVGGVVLFIKNKLFPKEKIEITEECDIETVDESEIEED